MGSPGNCCMQRRARQPPGEPVGHRIQEVAQLRHFALELGIAAASLGIGSCAAATALGGGNLELVRQPPQRRRQQQQQAAKGTWTLRIPIPGWKRGRFAPLRQRREEKGIWTFATAASLAGGGGGESLLAFLFYFYFSLQGQEHAGLDAAPLPASPLIPVVVGR